MFEKDFNKQMKKILNLLTEEDQETTAIVPQQSRNLVPTQQQQSQQNPQQDVDNQQVREIPNEKVQYLETTVMYYKNPPYDSANWPSEREQKVWLTPLMDGRIMSALAKSMGESFVIDKEAENGAARYRPYQFRVILHGTLTADVDFAVKTDAEENELRFRMTNLSVTTPHAGRITVNGSNHLLKNKKLNFKIKTDSKTIEGITGLKVREQEEEISSKDLKDVTYFLQKQFDIGETEAKELAKKAYDEYSPKDSNEAKSIAARLYKKQSDNKEEKKEHRFYNDAVDLAISQFDAKQNIAKKFAEWLTSKYNIKDEADLLRLVLKHYRDFEKGKITTESVNIKKYLNLLREIKEGPNGKYPRKEKGSEMKKDSVANILDDKIDSVIMKNIFKENGLTCNTNNRLFEGTVLEFFATSKADFVVDKIAPITSKANDVIISGKLKMYGEAWFDARVGENNRKLDSWTFRVHDRPDKVFLTKSFGVFGTKMIGSSQKKLEPKKPEGNNES